MEAGCTFEEQCPSLPLCGGQMEGGGDKTPSLTLSTCPVLKKGASNITNMKTSSDIFRNGDN